MTEKTNDASLIRCTVKKSIDVTKKIAGFVCKPGLVLGVLALLAYGFVTYYNVISSITGMIWGVVTYVPWWVYVIVAVPASIVLYSICWCIDRDLTSSDFNSDAAEYNIAIISIIFGIVGYLLMNNILNFVNDSFPYGILILSGYTGLVFFVSSYILFKDSTEDRGVGRAMRFFGAWYHHKKQLKNNENKEGDLE